MPSIFIKNNYKDNDSLYKEVEGLNLLKKYIEESQNIYLKIPQIYSIEKNKLYLQNIQSISSNKNSMENLALGLASLHKIKFDYYGLDLDNYIGLNLQKNTITKNWGEFFFKYRLLFQVELITNKNIKNEFISFLNSIKNKMIDLLNETTKHPSIVHGDLWSGNVLFSKKTVYLIDPAVYYADREVDIAMTELFGGFSDTFYKIYNNEYPLSKEYETKKIIYNLYHFLNHYNLFGISYLGKCNDSIKCIKRLL